MSQTLPYREGNLVVIYDARVFENYQRRKNIQKKISFFFFFIFFLSNILLVLPVFAAKGFFSKAQDNVPSPVLEETESQKQEQVDNIKEDFNLDDWLKQKEISFVPDRDFSLIIPRLDIAAKVVPLIDLSDQEMMTKALKEGAVQARRGASPGEKGTTYIFGHSTDSPLHISLYNAVFYPLKDITKDEEIIIIYKKMPYSYRVKEKKIINADNIQDLKSSLEEEKIALVTCWPPGTTLKRLVVTAIRVDK